MNRNPEKWKARRIVKEALQQAGVKFPYACPKMSWMAKEAWPLFDKGAVAPRVPRARKATMAYMIALAAHIAGTPSPSPLPKKRLPPSIVRQASNVVEGVDVASMEFLNTRAWRTLRYRAIVKHGNKCQACGSGPEQGRVINVDHIKPRKLYPELALALTNLQILCDLCNAGKGNWDQTDWREVPPVINAAEDGVPIPPSRTLN